MAVKVVKRKPRVFAFRFLVFGIISIIVISAVLGSLSKFWLNIYEKYKEKKELEEKLVLLKEDGEAKSMHVEKLQDPEEIARYWKEKYFYSGENEFIIKLPQNNSEK